MMITTKKGWWRASGCIGAIAVTSLFVWVCYPLLADTARTCAEDFLPAPRTPAASARGDMLLWFIRVESYRAAEGRLPVSAKEGSEQDVQQVYAALKPGFSDGLHVRDPWGRPYRLHLDIDGDGNVGVPRAEGAGLWRVGADFAMISDGPDGIYEAGEGDDIIVQLWRIREPKSQ